MLFVDAVLLLLPLSLLLPSLFLVVVFVIVARIVMCIVMCIVVIEVLRDCYFLLQRSCYQSSCCCEHCVHVIVPFDFNAIVFVPVAAIKLSLWLLCNNDIVLVSKVAADVIAAAGINFAVVIAIVELVLVVAAFFGC